MLSHGRFSRIVFHDTVDAEDEGVEGEDAEAAEDEDEEAAEDDGEEEEAGDGR